MIDDLSDAELRERLTGRGLSSSDADWLVRHRDDPEWSAEIEVFLA